jgi:hypothetical protein
MINDVVLEGIVVRAWKYAEYLLFYLACFYGSGYRVGQLLLRTSRNH